MIHIQARNYTRCDERLIDLLVTHTAEDDERPDSAEGIANYFKNQKPGNDGSSAHYATDSNSVVQCVFDWDIAWAAPNANRNGLHFEHAGRAAQTAKDWADPYSRKMLLLSAELQAKKSTQYGIPVVKLTPVQIRAGKLGFCGHRDVTAAFPGTGTHTDPGTHFPWPLFLTWVKAFKAGRVPKL